MAVITGYSSLQTAVTDWLAKGNLNSFVPNFIQNWEEKFYRQPKNYGRWMEFSFSLTIASDVIPVPADYLNLKYAYVNGSPSARLDRMSLNQTYGRFPRGAAPGFPEWISRDGANFVFGPEPDSDYTIKGVYWAKPTLLRSFAADAAAHWIILNAPDLVLYGALLEAEAFIKNDGRLQVWQGFYDRALENYRDLFSAEENSGSPVQEVLG